MSRGELAFPVQPRGDGTARSRRPADRLGQTYVELVHQRVGLAWRNKRRARISSGRLKGVRWTLTVEGGRRTGEAAAPELLLGEVALAVLE